MRPTKSPLTTRRALLTCSALPLLPACISAPKLSAGPLPADFKVGPLLVQSNFSPAEIKVTVVGRGGSIPTVSPVQKAEAQKLAIVFADHMREDFNSHFTDDARAAGLQLRGFNSPGMSLTLQAVRFEVNYTLPGGPGYRDDGPFSLAWVKGTLSDASGKELWWFRTSLIEPNGPAQAEWRLELGYKGLMKGMLKAMRTDGILLNR